MIKIGNPQACGDCPYRKDAPIKKWHISEFAKVLKSENAQYGLGDVFDCHKRNGSLCKGFLFNQIERGFPNNLLRILLSTNEITFEMLDEVTEANKDVEMYETIEKMCFSNYPQLQRIYKQPNQI